MPTLTKKNPFRQSLATCLGGGLLVVWVGLVPAPAQKAKQVFGEANKAFASQDYEAALPIYLEGLALDSANAAGNFYAGVCYLKTLYRRKALPYLRKAYAKNPGIDPRMDYLLGEAYQANSQFDAADAAYRLYKQNYAGRDPKEIVKVDKRLEECRNGIRYLKEPVNARIVNFGPVANTKFPDYAPVISADERVMFFTSRREGSTGNFVTMDGLFYEDVYVTFNQNGQWTPPRNMGATINTPTHDACIAVSPDGKQLFLYKDSRNGDIYSSTLVDSLAYRWSKPESLGDNVNSKYQEPSVSMTADGQVVYFSSDRPGGLGGLDIYLSRRDGAGKWGEAVNLGAPINTPYDEDAPFVHADGQTLYFSSRGHTTMGGYDIFHCSLEGNQWSEPENLGYPINTVDDDSYFVLSADNQHGYYASANEGSLGEKDIYVISMPPREEMSAAAVTEVKLTPLGARPVATVTEVTRVAARNPTTILRGVVLDALSRDSLAARLVLTDNASNEIVAELDSEPGTGKYTLVMPSGHNYGLAVEKDGYLFHSENYTIPASTGYQELTLDVALKKVKVGTKIILKNIFYDFNQATLKPESTAELKKLIELLNEVPDLKIELSGHTDNKGAADYNAKLSQRRAKAVVDYLIAKGVDPLRLRAKGYGSTRPLVTNKTEADRQLNRRTEFEIVGN